MFARDATELKVRVGFVVRDLHGFLETRDRFAVLSTVLVNQAELIMRARIAREQGRLQDAINHFGIVLEQDEKHAQSEIWREIGATYLAASMFKEAKDALEKFLDRRPYDPEGLYYCGKTLEQLAQRDEAREIFNRCIEAVKTMPSYRYREHRRWDKLAREQLKKPQITQITQTRSA